MESRRKRMVDLINREGSVGFSLLKTTFPEVSDMTLRRDLEYLDQSGQIVRVHGGARSVDVVIGTDDLYVRRSTRNVEQKKLIASKAKELVVPNTSIFLDSGTTVTEFAKVFPDGSYLIFTSSISCVLELTRLSGVQVHMLGGQLNRFSLSLNGTRSVNYLDDINFSIAFFGVTGYSGKMGFSCGVEEEYELKRAVMRKAEKVVMLMDSTKVGHAATFTFASLNEVDVVITDGHIDPGTLRELEQNGITVR